MDIPSQHLITVNATNHHGYLINKLWEFFQNKHKTDMCILSNGQMIQAHQLILEVFTSQEQLGYAALHDNSRNLDKILQFMYTGVIRVQPEDLDSLLHLATDLGFGMLVDALEATKSNSCQIYPENSDIMPSALINSDNHEVCDSMPPVPIVPTFEPCSINSHVKQEPLDQSFVEDSHLSDSQNIVALENGEGQFVDSLEIHEEAPDIVKHESNVDIDACPSKVVAGWKESQPLLSDGQPPVPTINQSISNSSNPTSRYPQRKRSRKNDSQFDYLLDPDWKRSTVDKNILSKRLATRAGTKSQLPIHGQILPADTSAIGLTMTDNQIKLKNPSTFSNVDVAKSSELNNINPKMVINELVKTKCDLQIRMEIKCSVCSKVVNNLKRHMLVHTGERPYACTQCPKTFSDHSNFSRHMTIHTGERSHACLQCPKTFSSSSHLSNHMRVHTGERPYACPKCPKTYTQSGALSIHMQVHTGERPFACLQCPKSFSRSTTLSLHMRVHTGERPFVCPQCPKTYSQSSHLSNHMRVHTGERPYACPKCPKTYSKSCELSIHIRSHTGERPHACPQCLKTFTRSRDLARHMLIHTNECQSILRKND